MIIYTTIPSIKDLAQAREGKPLVGFIIDDMSKIHDYDMITSHDYGIEDMQWIQLVHDYDGGDMLFYYSSSLFEFEFINFKEYPEHWDYYDLTEEEQKEPRQIDVWHNLSDNGNAPTKDILTTRSALIMIEPEEIEKISKMFAYFASNPKRW